MSVAGQAGDTPGTHVQRVREEGGLFFSHLGGLSGAECRFRGVFYEKGFLHNINKREDDSYNGKGNFYGKLEYSMHRTERGYTYSFNEA